MRDPVLFDGGLKNNLALKSELCSSWLLVGLFKLAFITIHIKTTERHVQFLIRTERPKENVFVRCDKAQLERAGTMAPSRLRRRDLKTQPRSQGLSSYRCKTLGTRLLITGHFGFAPEKKTRAGKSCDYRDVIVSEKLRFQNVFRPHWNTKPSFLNSLCLKSVFKKLRFRDGLVWTVALIVEIKLRF